MLGRALNCTWLSHGKEHHRRLPKHRKSLVSWWALEYHSFAMEHANTWEWVDMIHLNVEQHIKLFTSASRNIVRSPYVIKIIIYYTGQVLDQKNKHIL